MEANYRRQFDADNYQRYQVRFSKKKEEYLIEHVNERAQEFKSLNAYLLELVKDDYHRYQYTKRKREKKKSVQDEA